MDTGYASYRTLIWRRWPTTGALARFESAAAYDRTVADLVRSEVISDPGMIYFDVRPSAHLPTVELRLCDACPRLEDVILLAGLFRAVVIQESGAAVAGRPPLPVRPELVEGATWRAAQAGLEGNLVDPATATPVPAHQLIRQLLAGLRPALELVGDWELVKQLTESALARAVQRPGSARYAPAAALPASSTRWWRRPGPARTGSRVRDQTAQRSARRCEATSRPTTKRSSSTAAPRKPIAAPVFATSDDALALLTPMACADTTTGSPVGARQQPLAGAVARAWR